MVRNNIIAFVFILCLSLSIVSLVVAGNVIDFSSIIDFFANGNIFSDDFVSVLTTFPNITIGGDWSIFEGLRTFFNMFLNALSFVVYLGELLLLAIGYVIGVLRFLFV